MEISVKNQQGAEVGSIELSDRVWNADPNDALLQQVVVAQLANRRQGTHETKTRGQVSYSTRKLHGQKHSGRARLGSRKSPTLVGGGVIFGPHVRSYRQRTPKKMRLQALRVALSDKVREERLTVLDEFELATPRTRSVVELIDALNITGKTLIVVEANDPVLVLSVRGAEGVSVTYADTLSALSTTRSANLIATRGAVDRIEHLWDETRVAEEAVA